MPRTFPDPMLVATHVLVLLFICFSVLFVILKSEACALDHLVEFTGGGGGVLVLRDWVVKSQEQQYALHAYSESVLQHF